MKETVMVPTLDEMRAMSDAELLSLRTSISYDMSHIEIQIQDVNEPDPDWLRRARRAQKIRQHGINTVRNILAERKAAQVQPRVKLHHWMRRLQAVVDAAENLYEHDSDEQWNHLDAALKDYRDFSVAFGPSHLSEDDDDE
jgi:hypothetical protein